MVRERAASHENKIEVGNRGIENFTFGICRFLFRERRERKRCLSYFSIGCDWTQLGDLSKPSRSMGMQKKFAMFLYLRLRLATVVSMLPKQNEQIMKGSGIGGSLNYFFFFQRLASTGFERAKKCSEL